MEKYSYREFANITHTTLRTLRYYESINLILKYHLIKRYYITDLDMKMVKKN